MKNIIFTFSLALFFLVNAGCAKQVHKDWFATGGSKGDATVKLAITWNPNTEIPETNKLQAEQIASQKCIAWGYARAEAFGSMTQRCVNMGYTAYGPICYQMQAEAEYQCIEETTSPEATVLQPSKK